MDVKEFLLDDAETDQSEIVVDRKTGQARQAGADQPDGKWIVEFKHRAERSLFVFAKGVLGRDRLTQSLHRHFCGWLTRTPPYRKMGLLPRDHYKTTIASHALPMHIFIQPEEDNLYFPGRDGSEIRVLLGCETEARSMKHIRWIETQFESNAILRALWPHRCWEIPLKQSKKWNEREMLLPRKRDFADVSLQAIGVGGAITGAHFDVLIKDDLISLEAANSQTVMATAIEWHVASRALMDDPDKSLEFIIGTRWAVQDLYQYIEENDPTVEILKRSIVEDGQPIMPEVFSLETVDRLRKEFGVLFPLLYMNSAADPTLTDFSISDVRAFRIVDGEIVFDEDERDLLLTERHQGPVRKPELRPGTRLTPESYDLLFGRAEYFTRLRAT